jgi:hypothetical protein
MNDNNTFNGSKVQYIDQEQLKILAGTIRKYVNDLSKIKSKADIVWDQCSAYLDESALESINSVKSDNYKKYTSSMDELNNYANRVESVANIWDDTEKEIKTSSRKLESFFDDIGKTMRSAIEFSKKQ